MKIKHRALALILSAIMVLTFMPAMAFAGVETVPHWNASAAQDDADVYLKNNTAELAVDVEYDGYDEGSEPAFYYEWFYPGNGSDEPDEKGPDKSSISVSEPGHYYCVVSNSNYADDDEQRVDFDVYREHYFSGEEYDGGTIKAGETKDVVIENEYDFFSFAFIPEVTGKYNFRAEGNKDTVGRILDEEGDELDLEDDTYNGDSNFSINFEAEAGKTYYLQACLYTYPQDSEDYNPEAFVGAFKVKLQSGEFHNYVNQNNMVFYIINGSEAYVIQAGHYDANDNWIPDLKGNVVIPDKVAFQDGKTRKVTVLSDFSYNKALTGVTIPSTIYSIEDRALINSGLTSITIPDTVKDIGHYAVGYNYSYNDSTDEEVYTKVAGFTIFGKTGSAAQEYAKANGFTFRDLAAEQAAAAAAAKAAEQARNGIADGSLPKVKLSKPAAKKTSITVKWKKLTKKQLKKSKATHYEIWVSESSAYPAGATTKEIIVKKSKSKWTCKGLTKNKKYFVRIRAIKYVGGVKHVGPWKQRTIKTKKK